MMNPYRSEKIDKLGAAIIKSQTEMEAAIPDTRGHFKNDYPTLKALMMMSQHILNNNGLYFDWIYSNNENNEMILQGILTHPESDQWKQSVKIIKSTQTTMTSEGALVSYWKRLIYRDLIGMICEDDLDDDGKTESKTNERKQQEDNKKPKEEYITPEQLKVIMNAIGTNEDIYKELINKLKIANIKYMWKKVFDQALDYVNRSKKELENSRA